MNRIHRLDAAEQLVRAGRLDANETMFFERELERIETEVYDVLYPELKFRKLLPAGSGLGPADKFNTWRQFDKTGFAIEGSMDADDVPEVELMGSETVSTVQSVLIGWSINYQDLREAAKTGRPLDSMKAMAAREYVENKFEVMAASGSKASATNNIYGFLNQPNVPHISVSTGTSTAGYTNLTQAAVGASAAQQVWGPSAKKPVEIFRDLNNAYRQVVNLTNGVHHPNKLILDLASYNYISTTLMADADVSLYVQGTIKKYLLESCPWLQSIDYWLPCGAAITTPDQSVFGGHGSTGTAHTRAVLFEDKPRNIKYFIGQEFESFAPQLLQYKMHVPCHARWGGTVCYYPRSMVYLDGIGTA